MVNVGGTDKSQLGVADPAPEHNFLVELGGDQFLSSAQIKDLKNIKRKCVRGCLNLVNSIFRPVRQKLLNFSPKTYLDDGSGVALGSTHSDDVALSMHEHGLGLHIAALDVEAIGGINDSHLL